MFVVANAARDDMLPYFNETIAQLKNFLTPNETDDDQENKLKLQVQAIGKTTVSLVVTVVKTIPRTLKSKIHSKVLLIDEQSKILILIFLLCYKFTCMLHSIW